MDLERFEFKQPNYITTATLQQIVSNPGLAIRVTRNAATGLITFVDDSFLNATEYRTSGYDLKIDYRRPVGVGTIGLQAVGTLISSDKRQYAIGSPFLEYAGYPNDGGEGKLRSNTTLSWEYHGATLAWTTIYYANYKQTFSPGSPSAIQNGPNTTYIDAQGETAIPAQTYHDLYASYAFGERAADGYSRLSDQWLSGVTLQFGVKNLFGSRPPLDAAFNPYYYSPYGDPRLREYRLSVKVDF
jgi:hypothetical protein